MSTSNSTINSSLSTRLICSFPLSYSLPLWLTDRWKQRNEDRKFLYLGYLLKTIKANLPRWTIEVMFHEENLEPCMLKASLQVGEEQGREERVMMMYSVVMLV